MGLRCPYCHKRIRIPKAKTEVLLFPCPNCGGSIDLARIRGDDDTKVVYLSEGDLIEPQAADEGTRPRTWTDQDQISHGAPRHLHLFRWLGVMLSLILLIPLIAGYFFLKTTTRKDEAISRLNSYFSDVDHQNYRNAFRKYMASDLQRKISLEGYIREMEGIRRTLGPVRHRDLVRWSYRSTNRAKRCTVRYNSLYERGNAKERYTLVKARDGWKIFEFRIDPLPTKSQKKVLDT